MKRTSALEEKLAELESMVLSSEPTESGTIAYDDQAKVTIGGLTVSSPSGRMVSDVEKEIFGGDLGLESDKEIFDAEGAIVGRQDGKVVVTADSMSITPKEVS